MLFVDVLKASPHGTPNLIRDPPKDTSKSTDPVQSVVFFASDFRYLLIAFVSRARISALVVVVSQLLQVGVVDALDQLS